jgi:hypothetical protein
MVALQIRDVPDDVRQTLAEQASRRGQSLQSFLLTLVTDEARRSANVAILTRFADRNDGSALSSVDMTHMIDQARAARDLDSSTNPT